MMTAVRILVLCAEDPSVRLSIEDLADRAGLTVPVTREVLSSDEYADMLRDACRNRVLTVLSRSVGRVERIIDSDNDKLALDAVAKATTLYKVLTETGPRHRESEAEHSAEVLLKQLEAMGQLRRVEATLSPS